MLFPGVQRAGQILLDQRKQRFLPRIAEVLDGKSAFGEKPTAACRQTFLPERGAVKGVATALRGKML